MTRDKLLQYVEYIALRYYRKHYQVFEKDAVSLEDLKQEAKVICLKIHKKYHKKNDINGFNIKKFTARAVGWRLGDLLRGAIVNSSNVLRYEDFVVNNGVHGEDSEAMDKISEDVCNRYHRMVGCYPNEEFYHTLAGDVQYGFNVKDILALFEGKHLTILQKMLECKSIAQIQKEMGYKNNNSIHNTINSRIRPKIRRFLKKQISEIDGLSI